MRVQVRGHHPLRPGIQPGSPDKPFYHSRPARRNRDTRSHNTAQRNPDGYHAQPVWPDPLSLATTHGISFPAGTEMFHFPAYPPGRRRCRPMTAGGFPIRKSSDQSPVGGSPRHIAASNVLHRYCLPRHPPYALASGTHHERRAWPQDSSSKIARRQIITLKMITKRSKRTPNSIRRV